MTKLAELAGTTKLRGPVTITDASGATRTYADEDAACEAWSGKLSRLAHRRGAFFERPSSKRSRKRDAREETTTD